VSGFRLFMLGALALVGAVLWLILRIKSPSAVTSQTAPVSPQQVGSTSDAEIVAKSGVRSTSSPLLQFAAARDADDASQLGSVKLDDAQFLIAPELLRDAPEGWSPEHVRKLLDQLAIPLEACPTASGYAERIKIPLLLIRMSDGTVRAVILRRNDVRWSWESDCTAQAFWDFRPPKEKVEPGGSESVRLEVPFLLGAR